MRLNQRVLFSLPQLPLLLEGLGATYAVLGPGPLTAGLELGSSRPEGPFLGAPARIMTVNP